MTDNKFNEKQELIEWGLKNNKCPCCGKLLGDKEAVGSGRISDGRFCSLDCYAKFYYAAKEKETAQE